jgi:hypothetical protein
MGPRAPLAVTLAVLAALLWIADARPVDIAIADAALHEGSWVRVAGLASDVRPTSDGARFQMAAEGATLPVESAQAPPPAAWLEATGRLARSGGRLTLFAESVAVAAPQATQRPSWDDAARLPQQFALRAIELSGWVEKGTLADHDGHRLQLGEGPWPHDGAVRARGALRYDEGCLCHHFDAAEVAAWTP